MVINLQPKLIQYQYREGVEIVNQYVPLQANYIVTAFQVLFFYQDGYICLLLVVSSYYRIITSGYANYYFYQLLVIALFAYWMASRCLFFFKLFCILTVKGYKRSFFNRRFSESTFVLNKSFKFVTTLIYEAFSVIYAFRFRRRTLRTYR